MQKLPIAYIRELKKYTTGVDATTVTETNVVDEEVASFNGEDSLEEELTDITAANQSMSAVLEKSQIY